ncbi:hypothetical protein PIB30_004292 [Stylosanthes scabra]|uniref:TIR domain-containing protein n=1 Tax=Stylosanthes scabra TaxID=79078 RepID=A0ABU6T4M7_9FABA|nr:hypothetical protein [Stylosanthes scabra]
MDLQSPFSSFSSSFTYKWKYDVFLSFRGQDTGHSFTRDLYRALCDKGILPFFDDDEFQRKEVKPIIEESRIAIVVLSPNYAASSSCLDELANIIDCIKRKNRLVLPIFYDVDPSDVRHQRNSIAIAMAEHEERLKDNMGKVHKWKEALHQVANLSGYQFKPGNGYEYMFIEDIVENIWKKIRIARLHIADYPVGLESQVSKVTSLLEIDSTDEVHMVGIYGIGGIGKSTLARAIYNLIADYFEDVCFLQNVRETSISHGLVHLQSILLNDIVGDRNIKIANVHEGISQIRQRLYRRKVLLILDDVDRREQLQFIAGKPDWFGPGSRVIITTRDKHLLRYHDVEKRYEVKGLNMKESMDLLTWHAFKSDTVSPGYSDILRRAATYARGLPLALEVIGSNVYVASLEESESMMDKYERIPDINIQNVLQISFDALEKDEKKVFLDISCCFKGYKLMEIKDMLLARYGRHMDYHIRILGDKSLIHINQNYEVGMHDLIEQMGKEIVRQEQLSSPGKLSRLWLYEDIVHVLENNQGTSAIEIMHLKFPLTEEEENEEPPRIQRNKDFEVIWDGEAFRRMKNIEILIIKNGCFSTPPSYLPNSLRVLEWWKYPSEYLPAGFHPKKLSILKLPKNILSLQLDSFSKKFVALRVLIFDYSKSLTELPDVSGIPNLQELSLRGCENLISVHPSVGLLNKLEVLNASSCYNLRSLPPINLPSLQILRLSGC